MVVVVAIDIVSRENNQNTRNSLKIVNSYLSVHIFIYRYTCEWFNVVFSLVSCGVCAYTIYSVYQSWMDFVIPHYFRFVKFHYAFFRPEMTEDEAIETSGRSVNSEPNRDESSTKQTSEVVSIRVTTSMVSLASSLFKITNLRSIWNWLAYSSKRHIHVVKHTRKLELYSFQSTEVAGNVQIWFSTQACRRKLKHLLLLCK